MKFLNCSCDSLNFLCLIPGFIYYTDKLHLLLLFISATTCVLSLNNRLTEEEFKHIYGKLDARCPSVDDPHNPVHYPHPFECNFFYKCANGVGHLFECPPNLHWCIATDRCERPEDANCQIN